MKEELVLQLLGGEVTAVNAAALSRKLFQMANGAVYADAGETAAVHERKLDALEDIIEAVAAGIGNRGGAVYRRGAGPPLAKK